MKRLCESGALLGKHVGGGQAAEEMRDARVGAVHDLCRRSGQCVGGVGRQQNRCAACELVPCMICVMCLGRVE